MEGRTNMLTTTNNWFSDLRAIMGHKVSGRYLFGTKITKILLWSPENGTGKTTAPVLIAKELERDIISSTLFVEQEQDQILGPVLISKGSTECKPVLISEAMLKGCILVINEVDQYSPDVETMLNCVLDDPNIARVQLPDGRSITPNPGFCVIGTTNARPDELPDRLRERFDIVIGAHTPAPGILDNVSSRWHAGLMERYKDTSHTYFAELSTRRAIAHDKLVNSGVCEETALRWTFGNDERGLNALQAALTAISSAECG